MNNFLPCQTIYLKVLADSGDNRLPFNPYACSVGHHTNFPRLMLKLEKEKGTTGNTNHVTLRNFSFPGERFCLFFHSAGNASNILEKKVSAYGAREVVSLSRQGRRDKGQITLLAILENSTSFCTVFYFSLRTEQIMLF